MDRLLRNPGRPRSIQLVEHRLEMGRHGGIGAVERHGDCGRVMATLNTLLAPDLLQPGTQWTLLSDVNGYGRPTGDSLTTQGRCGRSIRLLQRSSDRLLVQLLEDGYRCWMDLEALIGRAKQLPAWTPTLLPGNGDPAATAGGPGLERARRTADQPLPLGRHHRTEHGLLWLDAAGLCQPGHLDPPGRLSARAFLPTRRRRGRRAGSVASGGSDLLRLSAALHPMWGSTSAVGRYRHSSGHQYGRNGIGVDSHAPFGSASRCQSLSERAAGSGARDPLP